MSIAYGQLLLRGGPIDRLLHEVADLLFGVVAIADDR
jgi:hypothetical protein